MSEERPTPRAQPPTAAERELVAEAQETGRHRAPARDRAALGATGAPADLAARAVGARARRRQGPLGLCRRRADCTHPEPTRGLLAATHALAARAGGVGRIPSILPDLGRCGLPACQSHRDQVRTFTNNLPHIVNEANRQIASFQADLDKHGMHAKLVGQGKTALQTIQDQVSKSAGKLATFGGALLTEVAKALVDLVLVFVLSVYMLVYGQTIGKLVRQTMPPGDGSSADDYPRLAQHAVSRYVGGQLLFSVVMGASSRSRALPVRAARDLSRRSQLCARFRSVLRRDGARPLHRPDPGRGSAGRRGAVHQSDQRSLADDRCSSACNSWRVTWWHRRSSATPCASIPCS